jgi:metal-responsive CopG/Arc/MetJ family transcriptional regulator
MKIKVSVSMEESTVKEVQEHLQESMFRNQSHLIEMATKKYLQEIKNGRN